MAQTETKDLVKVLAEKSARFKAAYNAYEQKVVIDGSNIDLTPAAGALKELKTLQGEIQEIQGIIELKQFGSNIDNLLNTPEGVSVARQVGAHGAMSPFATKSLGQMFTESQEFKAMISDGARDSKNFSVPYSDIVNAAAQWGQKDVYTGMADDFNVDMSVGTRVQVDAMVPRGQLRDRVRDLFPAQSTSANMITFIRVEGFTTNSGKGNAASVADWDAGNSTFGTKPKSALEFSAEKAPVETIAHYELAHRNILDDVPQLRGLINNELMYGLKLEEDNQILNGSGTNNQLLGLLNTSGTQSHTRGGSDSYADALRRAATKCVLAYFPATGYVLHPNDWETTELTKATGDGQYVLVSNVALGAQRQVWRLPVVETPAMPQGKFVAGAFGLGAQLYDRQDANIRISDSHANTFVQNAITILCEERLALAVKRPEAFVIGTF